MAEGAQNKSIVRSFPGSFWIANTIEIFERMGWYGFYAVSSLYLTGKVAEGGLGFSSEERGIIQGLITFFLYLFPAVFGALADKYGYKKMFLASFMLMSPMYIFLSMPTSFWGFFTVYFFIAIGHGMFKPVVVGTIAKLTDERTGTLGFGIFYMMVNIGGFLGPIAAGIVRGWDWKYVFYASAIWIACNFFICLLFYKEPPRDEEAQKGKTLKDVLDGMMKVVGNARFFLMIAGIMVALVLGSKWWDFSQVAVYTGIWIAFNFVWDFLARTFFKETGGQSKIWLLQPMKVGETKYLLYLLLLSGFWVSFNQIFITLPEYIRDYVNTSDLIRSFGLEGAEASGWGRAILKDGQIKPEYLINLNAFGIICLQIFISYFARKWKPFTTIIAGVMITVGSFFIYTIGATGWIVVFAILVFSVGEMLASPKSQEYVGRIAPPEKIGMYMGYYFWCIAIGNLFGGLLSGVAYQHFGPEGVNKPNQMWALFAGLAFTTAVLLWFYNRWIKRTKPAESK